MLYFRYIYIVYLYHKSYNVLEGGAIMKESTGEKIKRLRKEKRLFWQSLIKSISIDDNFNITSVEFF